LHFIVGIISLSVIAYDYFKTKKFDYLKIIGILFIASFLMLFSGSNFIWKLPFLNQIDFPWRLLGVVMFLLALISGILAKTMYRKIIVFSVILGIIFMNLKYIKTRDRIYNDDNYYSTNMATTTSANELMPIWVKEDPVKKSDSEAEIIQGVGNVSVIQKSDQQLIIKSSISGIIAATIQVNKIYFPGWTAYRGDHKYSVISGPNGLINIENVITHSEQPEGITLQYRRTPVRFVADILSIISFIALVYLWKYLKKLRRI
jgi:hypothetical protein